MSYKEEAKTWIQSHVKEEYGDSEVLFTPKDMIAVVGYMLDDIIPKALEAQREACVDAGVMFNTMHSDIAVRAAILNASIGDKKDKPNPKWTYYGNVL